MKSQYTKREADAIIKCEYALFALHCGDLKCPLCDKDGFCKFNSHDFISYVKENMREKENDKI